MPTNTHQADEPVNPGMGGRLVLGAIMVLAILSYLTLTTNAPKAAGGGIYELELAKLPYAGWLDTEPARPTKMPARARLGRSVIQ